MFLTLGMCLFHAFRAAPLASLMFISSPLKLEKEEDGFISNKEGEGKKVKLVTSQKLVEKFQVTEDMLTVFGGSAVSVRPFPQERIHTP